MRGKVYAVQALILKQSRNIDIRQSGLQDNKYYGK